MDGDPIASLQSLLEQPAGEPAGGLIQFAVRNLLVSAEESRCRCVPHGLSMQHLA